MTPKFLDECREVSNDTWNAFQVMAGALAVKLSDEAPFDPYEVDWPQVGRMLEEITKFVYSEALPDQEGESNEDRP